MNLGASLGGGGAKGFSHVGVLKVLAAEGIAFDVVAGTSIGSLVGAAYSGGKLAEFERIARNIKLKDIPLLLGPSWSLSGMFSGKTVLDLLGEVIGVADIEALPTRFAAVAVSLDTGERVLFTRGDLCQAVRASMAIPGIFTPVQHAGHLLVDGGTLEPIPVEAARSLGANIVVAIDLFHGKRKRPPGTKSALTYLRKLGKPADTELPPTIIEVMQESLALNQRELTKFRLIEHPPDCLIQPDVSDIGPLDFHRADVAITRGEDAGRAALAKIRNCISAHQ